MSSTRVPSRPETARATSSGSKASGRGIVHSTTVARRRPEKGGDYNICLVTLEEGPRLMSRVIEIAPEEVKIGHAGHGPPSLS